MTHFQLTVFGYFVVWLLAVGFLVAAVAGKIQCFCFSKLSDCYLLCGGLIIIVTAAFVFLLHTPFSQEIRQASQADVEQLTRLKDFMNLLVSLLGGGVGGNLITSAISLARKKQ